jgi:hypothetical protein
MHFTIVGQHMAEKRICMVIVREGYEVWQYLDVQRASTGRPLINSTVFFRLEKDGKRFGDRLASLNDALKLAMQLAAGDTASD